MWSFASHAGAGIAVAGLSATYYALNRMNYQLERGHTEGPALDEKSRTLMSAKGAYASIPATQMLLKKELDNLAQDSGHSMGLNSVSDKNLFNAETNNQGERHSSNMAIRRIISRAQTNFPKSPSLAREQRQEDPVFETRHDQSLQNELSNETEGDSLSVFDVEEFSRLEMSEDDLNEEDKMKDNSAGDSRGCGLKICQCSGSNDAMKIQRSKSPIICYLNPGFGKRFACKIQGSSLKFPQSPINKPISDDSYKDSTQFLFPPVLSDSKVSICGDDEEEEHFEEDIPRRFDQSIDDDDITANAFIIKGLSRMDEIRDYNLQLQVMQDVRKSQDASALAETPIPEPDIPLLTNAEKISSLELSDQIDAFFLSPESKKEDFVDCQIDKMEDSKFPEVENQESLSSSCIMHSIPASSWVSLPARLYADSETASSEVIIFLGIVILLFGIMGKFFFTLSTWFAMLPADDESNPSAMMEH